MTELRDRTIRKAILIAVIVLAGSAVAASARQATTPASETGSQFYLRYVTAVRSASTIDDVLAFWRQQAVQQYRSAPDAQKMGLADIKTAYNTFTDIKVVTETGSPTSGTLTVQATFNGRKMNGTAYIVKENGAWKLFGPENWAPATE